MDPEVNCSSAVSAAGARVRSAGVAVSPTTTGSSARPAAVIAWRTSVSSSTEVTTTRGTACSRIAATCEMYCAISANMGGAIGVKTPPHAHTA
ncbi:Uncharacterised protein [Nocardia africana]|uniref:Uncharacterized protein n=1 Tax=Nocardia africana TaxID=134964 RepID=A0A378X0W1_9NOCA|nr:Uncharacterised protein [Nocardia africana]